MIASIGEFEVKSELGKGGMGVVYLAHDPGVGRDVAIKVLTNEGDGDLLARFRSEAGTTAKLTHKNIVTIYAFGDQEGMPYIVMELLEGEDLGSVIGKRRPLTLLQKVDVLHQVAEGLSFAHQKNVIHRDIKPRNIMLLPDGTAKVMDFGIARVTGSDSTRRTQKGYLIGTIAYMAPEQFTRGTDADQLVDIFAYGDVAYELITGQHPFGQGEAGALISRITSAEPAPIRTLAPDCPEMLAAIVQQLLAKDRDLRYQSLKDLLLDMEQVLFQLRHDRAVQILAEAHLLKEQAQLDAALAKVKEAVELDPMNREADQLKRRLQEELRGEMMRKKVADMVAEADRKIAQRSFSEAVLLLESALQLDKSDTVRARLEGAVREQNKVKRAVQLLGDAKRQENLKTAVAKAAEALEIDPQNTQAPHVLKRLREELEKRERRLAEALQGAAACAGKQVFAKAFEILDKVAEEQGELPEIAAERERVRAALAEFQRTQRQKSFDEGMVSARAAMNAGDLTQARAMVDSLTAGYADVPRAPERAKVLSDELARRERRAEIGRIAREAGDLVRQEQFESGHAKLDAALARYPGEPELQVALENLLKAKAARERAEAISVAAAHIGQLHREGSLESALQAAQAAAREYPDYKEFQDLLTEIGGELQERQRRAKIDEVSRRATALLESNPFQAGELLQSTLAEVGPEAYLESLLTAAQRAAGRRREQQAVDDILAKVTALRAAKKLREAVEELERAIVQYPGRSELRLAASEVRLELDRMARAEKLGAATQAIQKALAEGDLQKCGALIDEARNEFRNEPGIEQLAAELARAQRARELAALSAGVRQSLARDDVEAAARQLAGFTEQLAATSDWKALKAETDERRDYLKTVEKAGQLAAEARFDEAEQLLEPYVKAGRKRAVQAQQAVAEGRRAAEAREKERKEQERKAAEARAREIEERERQAAETRVLERKEQERVAAETRVLEVKDQGRKAAEARALAAREQERKAAEARALAAKEQERKAVEARALAAKEQERKAVEAQALAAKEQERRAAEAKALAAEKQERKAAEAQALAAKEQERKAAEARAREIEERERQAAETRVLERKEQERVAAETRVLEVKDQERKAAEAREKERQAQDPSATRMMPVEGPPTIATPAYKTPPAAKAKPAGKTEAPATAARPPVPAPIEPVKPIAPPPFTAAPVTETPIYRRPAFIAPVAITVLVLGYVFLRPSSGPPVPKTPPMSGHEQPPEQGQPKPPTVPAVDKAILPKKIEFLPWQKDTAPPREIKYPIPDAQLRLITPKWQEQSMERNFHVRVAPGELIFSVTTGGMDIGRNSATLVLNLPGDDYREVNVSITVMRAIEYKKQTDQIQWLGSLNPGESVTVHGASFTQGDLQGGLAVGELPKKPISVVEEKLGQYNLTVESGPSAQNDYALRLRNSGSAPLHRFTLFYHAAK